MMRDLLRHLFHPYQPTPAPPDVRLSTLGERNEIEERKELIRARMKRLELEAEIPAMRAGRQMRRHE